jgi:hypothetical protein
VAPRTRKPAERALAGIVDGTLRHSGRAADITNVRPEREDSFQEGAGGARPAFRTDENSLGLQPAQVGYVKQPVGAGWIRLGDARSAHAQIKADQPTDPVGRRTPSVRRLRCPRHRRGALFAPDWRVFLWTKSDTPRRHGRIRSSSYIFRV